MADPFGNIPLNIGTNPPGAPQPTPTNTAAPTPSPVPAAPQSATPAPLAVPIAPIPREAPVAARMSIPTPTLQSRTPELTPVTHVMPRRSGGAGPLIGAGIIVVLFIFGGLYFWGAHLNAQEKAPLPLISGDPAQQ